VHRGLPLYGLFKCAKPAAPGTRLPDPAGLFGHLRWAYTDPMNPSYTWTYRIDVPPYDRLVEVLEAFFASYPGGEYLCERRDRFALRFRRGQWRKSMMGLGPLVPDRLVKGRFGQWPIMVRVLVRPSPEVFTSTVHYDLYLPKEVRSISPTVQSSVDQHAREELKQLAAYLAECVGLDDLPRVVGR